MHLTFQRHGISDSPLQHTRRPRSMDSVGQNARDSAPQTSLLHCAKTVSERHLFEPLRFLFERKQIPQIVVIVRISRNATEPLEATRLPWRTGVVSRSRGPRDDWLAHTSRTQIPPTLLQAQENARSTRLLALIK